MSMEIACIKYNRRLKPLQTILVLGSILKANFMHNAYIIIVDRIFCCQYTSGTIRVLDLWTYSDYRGTTWCFAILACCSHFTFSKSKYAALIITPRQPIILYTLLHLSFVFINSFIASIRIHALFQPPIRH